VTDNINHEIVSTTNGGKFDFLMVGAGSSMMKTKWQRSFLARVPLLNRFLNLSPSFQSVHYPGLLAREKTQVFVESCHCSVGIFINRHFTVIGRTLVVIQFEEDAFLLRYARRLLRNNHQVKISLMDVNGLAITNEIVGQGILALIKEFPDSVKMTASTLHDQPFMKDFSFMLISYKGWNHLAADETQPLRYVPSTLIINKKPSRFHAHGTEDPEEGPEGDSKPVLKPDAKPVKICS
jgi:hypothetical protein